MAFISVIGWWSPHLSGFDGPIPEEYILAESALVEVPMYINEAPAEGGTKKTTVVSTQTK